MTFVETMALPNAVRLIDDYHLDRPGVIGTYVLLGDEPALIDPGPTTVLPHLEMGLQALGLTLDDIRAVLLSHIHLDHAGATGTIVARNPHVKVYVHQRGAPHIVAPERLLRSAARLYQDMMDYLWGEFCAVPQDNVVPLSGGEMVQLGSRKLQVYDAPGHASHHVVYFEEASGAAFIGDNGGVCLPGSSHSRPATPPPDIDVEAWVQTLNMVLDLQPKWLLLTHFGAMDNPARYIDDYRTRLLQWADIVQNGMQSGADEAAQIAQLQARADADLGASADSELGVRYQQAISLEQTWQGLVRYWQKRAEREHAAGNQDLI
ncbi:MAG: MBL fold metallo-hydrolase [Chloroflexi bacterium AL-W]|nr:MBL fold metallo-hydrolase [Chloroflexi bacterium AL-N1]NOK66182.1 MBL fold metallo-hydrolase [Chloroflexi bacterium AL-N10]NOK73063.1 MBL fold metallo-hydrolase [Chloroflexi bacterium AL-N5]NOK79960.1 MBL fold metallo-hydrolase [Chloroflexi bacterium AL-W]NOK88184.1 MBL fold metallo-hydrolase [Chloroflexi bacterium AL-N15]